MSCTAKTIETHEYGRNESTIFRLFVETSKIIRVAVISNGLIPASTRMLLASLACFGCPGWNEANFSKIIKKLLPHASNHDQCCTRQEVATQKLFLPPVSNCVTPSVIRMNNAKKITVVTFRKRLLASSGLKCKVRD